MVYLFVCIHKHLFVRMTSLSVPPLQIGMPRDNSLPFPRLFGAKYGVFRVPVQGFNFWEF